MKAIRILIIAGTAGVRTTLAEIVASDPALAVMGTAADPLIAAKRIAVEIPDAIVLDLETPRMSGLHFLKKLMEQCPLPVLVFTTQAKAGSPLLVEAMHAGAEDVMVLPETGTREHLYALAAEILEKIKIAARQHAHAQPLLSQSVQPKLSADVILPPRPRWATVAQTERVVCIGASTGGTDSLPVVLKPLPGDCPGIVIVQHMPEGFTDTFAQRLDSICRIVVKEAAHGDAVLPGQALLAPGSHHLLLARRGNRYVVELNDGPLVSRHRPSVDVLFRSASRSAGGNAMGVLLTGMGDDGAQGLLEMRQAGALTIAEHESTCVVFGMPKEAIQRGAAERVVPLPKIAEEILSPGGRWR
ncbi:MAG: chemotaxis response regulator protein-glutamate methylesterase [Magnetococcus sp. YQC-3]